MTTIILKCIEKLKDEKIKFISSHSDKDFNYFFFFSNRVFCKINRGKWYKYRENKAIIFCINVSENLTDKKFEQSMWGDHNRKKLLILSQTEMMQTINSLFMFV